MYYASDELKNNKAFMLDVVKIDGNMLCNASESLKNDKEVVIEAVKNDERAIQFVGYSINIDDILDEIHQFSHKKFKEELSNEAFGKDLDSMKQNYNEEIISSIDSQEGLFDLSDDLKIDIEKIEGMITSLTSLKKLLEEKRNLQIKICELDKSIDSLFLSLQNNYGVAIMSIEEADKIILNKFSQRKEENGKQYTLGNL